MDCELIKPYDINEARMRVAYFDDILIKYAYECNEKLRYEIERSAFGGYKTASIDITIHSNSINQGVALFLQEKYQKAGYKTEIEELKNWGETISVGYRLHVNWGRE